MADFIHWQSVADQAGLVRQACLLLGRGELVAFPGSDGSILAANALAPEAVEHLGDGPVLALPSAGHALDWAPGLGPLGRRLARRLWPGPLTLVCGDGWQDGLVRRLDGPVRGRLCAGGRLGLCVPDHPALGYAVMLLPCPVVVSAAPSPLPEAAALIIAADGCPSPSVVEIANGGWRLLKEGAVRRRDIEAQARCRVMFVCTGNTCRSPMAEALCRKLLADRLGCRVEELGDRGYEVVSAGLAAGLGQPAAAEALAAVRELGADLADHASRPLTADLVRQADFLITMTLVHQGAILSRFTSPGVRPRTLCPQGGDVADPFGAGPDVYRRCAQEILGHLQHWIAELERPCA